MTTVKDENKMLQMDDEFKESEMAQYVSLIYLSKALPQETLFFQHQFHV